MPRGDHVWGAPSAASQALVAGQLHRCLGGIQVISTEQLYPSGLSFNINTQQWFHLMPVEDIISEALLFAHPTDRYSTLEDAKLALSEDFNLSGLVAPTNQLDLWT